MNIERTLFWFKDGDEPLTSFDEDFFGIATLLNRLLNEKYNGKRIKYINIDFFTNKTYELHPILPKDTPYYYGGHLRFYGLLDITQFNVLSWNDKKYYIWGKAHNYMKNLAEFTNNNDLLDAVEYAYIKGLETKLDPDFRLFNINIDINNQIHNVSLWIKFSKEMMHAMLIIERDEKQVFVREIDRSSKKVEFFLSIFKALEFDGTNILIRGRKDVDYLPLKLPLTEIEMCIVNG